MSVVSHFFGSEDLLYRLSSGLAKEERHVVFLFGAGLSLPLGPGQPGVPDARGIVEAIKAEFSEDRSQLDALDQVLARAGAKQYQAAFLFIQGRLGQSAANGIVRQAVLKARAQDLGDLRSTSQLLKPTEEDCTMFDLDSDWVLNPGCESFGNLVAQYPKYFGQHVLTTNFDPLIEVSIRAAGGVSYRTSLHSDGDISQTVGQGCHVIHLHGYWHGYDTLHTNRQLERPRPHLRASLANLLRNSVIVVCGYSGWDDVFTETLVDVVNDGAARSEILWTFYSSTPTVPETLERGFSTGIDRGRLSLYAGIDCNSFIPRLLTRWHSLASPAAINRSNQGNLVQLSSSLQAALEVIEPAQRTLEGDDEDRPPLAEFCVGREAELEKIESSGAKVVFLTGIGGQGKSTVASRYFAAAQTNRRFKYVVWRDCKEESERFENQLAAIVEKLSGGRISGPDLAKQDVASIVRLLTGFLADVSVLFVFDNADHYVNLEGERMTLGVDSLIDGLIASTSDSQMLVTCRPSVQYSDPRTLSIHLAGISVDAARALFDARGAVCSEAELIEAHNLTDGHAFWLDLISIQVAKRQPISLRQILKEVQSGDGSLPENTLSSIWSSLNDKQRLVLRSMAETVRPATEFEIADYLQRKANYKQIMKALRTLRALNLIVVKRRPEAEDVVELHPLVRQFVRNTFSRSERTTFIEEIIKVYKNWMTKHRGHLAERPTFTTLQYWTQAAELDVAAGRIADAFLLLGEVAVSFANSAFSREFSRAVRILLSSFDWVEGHTKYKQFDGVFNLHVYMLDDLGEWSEVDQLLNRFEMTVQNRDARYIFYCDMQCHSKWVRGQYGDAIKWGLIGHDLKTSSKVDTEFDVAYNLALARRDAGEPELALSTFLAGRSLDDVTNPDELDEERNAAHYGNVGRCLHLLGQVDSALVCYQKSAILLEKDPRTEHVVNQGYARRWIGELLAARKQARLAGFFLEAARRKWQWVSPHRALEIEGLQKQLRVPVPLSKDFSEQDIERVCRDWMLGRITDV